MKSVFFFGVFQERRNRKKQIFPVPSRIRRKERRMSLENTHFGADRIGGMLHGCSSIFFIGIGGISMSALAHLSRSAGFRVGGSDRGENDQVALLRAEGIPVFPEHDRKNIAGYDAVVYTVAISPDNPEYLAAKDAGIPLLSRADYLGYLMTAYRTRIGIAGMHGKSTCTAMCAQIFLRAADPTVLCGAELPSLGGSTYRIGRDREHFVFEACEYMDSFLDFSPTLAVILNIGMDHVDYFHSMEQIRTSFLRFAERTGKTGAVLFNADDPESALAMAPFPGEKHSFSAEGRAEFSALHIRVSDGRMCFDFCRDGKLLTPVSLRVFGWHNIYNALAAASAAVLCGVSPALAASALSEYTGAHRRMEWRGTINGAQVYDDYAHHPDEIRATLAGIREMGFERILCAYQPHTYSRTAGLYDEFVGALKEADLVFLADIYAAREQNTFGVSSAALAEKIGSGARYCASFASVAEELRKAARPGDAVIVMGAGDIYHVLEMLFPGESGGTVPKS